MSILWKLFRVTLMGGMIFPGQAYARWQYDYTLTDLSNKTTAELRLLRNEVYARAGYIFKDPELNEYFTRQPWYVPGGFHPIKWHYVEREYLKKIIEAENAYAAGYRYWSLQIPTRDNIFECGEVRLFPDSIEEPIIRALNEGNGLVYTFRKSAGVWGFSPYIWQSSKARPRSFSFAASRLGPPRDVFCSPSTGGIYYNENKECGGPSKVPPKVDGYSGMCGHISLAIDSYNRSHLSFYDEERKALVYGYLKGKPWEKKEWVLRDIDAKGDAGTFNVLKVDHLDRAHIVYYDAVRKRAKYALIGGGEVNVEELPSIVSSGSSLSMAVDAAGSPHVSYYDSDAKLWYSRKTGGSWRTTLVSAAGPGGGEYSALTLSTSSAASIVYYDAQKKSLLLAVMKNGVFETQTVDPSVAAPKGIDLAVDGGGTPHIAYCVPSETEIRYAVRISSRKEMESALFKKKAVLDRGATVGLMVPFDDVTPPKTEMSLIGPSYTREGDGTVFVSVGTLVDFSADDRTKCGDVSGPARGYYSIDHDIAPCLDGEYLYFQKHRKFFPGGEDADPGPGLSSRPYCGVIGGVFPLSLPEGAHDLHYLSADHWGNFEETKSVRFYVDKTAPETEVLVENGELRDGKCRLKKGGVVRLEARDPSGPGKGAGVMGIEYSVDEFPPVSETEQDLVGLDLYSAPLSFTPGEHTLYFRAKDKVENAEALKTLKIIAE
ncbi:MAG TPA: YARHG domain-containing protein [Elusimicrobiales bacterium]|nr:YARHG domain-containing protein [Elusimicrobiales bacterium]